MPFLIGKASLALKLEGSEDVMVERRERLNTDETNSQRQDVRGKG